MEKVKPRPKPTTFAEVEDLDVTMKVPFPKSKYLAATVEVIRACRHGLGAIFEEGKDFEGTDGNVKVGIVYVLEEYFGWEQDEDYFCTTRSKNGQKVFFAPTESLLDYMVDDRG